MFRIPVIASVLSLGLLMGCGEDAAERETIDDILGGRTVNGCDPEEYEDLTGSPSVTITDDDNAWEVPHNRCIIVSAGTAVTWQGNFDTHPLVGGESPTTDTSSPITQANASGTDDVTVTFSPTRGQAFPYFCDVHRTDMLGVIVVVPST
ncbi:MAG: hypothetical protein JSU89_12775 [Myxococcales bacterium]|nr:MAG: hypothetical protein JSU89_12775 [Myxococcales bacterium]